MRVRIPPGVWMCLSCGCCVLSGTGLCVWLITRPIDGGLQCNCEALMTRPWSTRVWCAIKKVGNFILILATGFSDACENYCYTLCHSRSDQTFYTRIQQIFRPNFWGGLFVCLNGTYLCAREVFWVPFGGGGHCNKSSFSSVTKDMAYIFFCIKKRYLSHENVLLTAKMLFSLVLANVAILARCLLCSHVNSSTIQLHIRARTRTHTYSTNASSRKKKNGMNQRWQRWFEAVFLYSCRHS